MRFVSYPFSKEGQEKFGQSDKKARDWPVLYLINGEKELYIGETQNAYNRFGQHLENSERKRLTDFSVIIDDEFNKSAILDLEQQLIKLCGADKKFTLQNLNGGQSYRHDYYERERYLGKIDAIWEALTKHHLVSTSLDTIRNSDLFKYSPYSNLTYEQAEVSSSIIEDAIKTLGEQKEGTAIIEGGPGTGKTIVLINILYRLANAAKFKVDPYEALDEEQSDYMRVLMGIQHYLNRQNGKPLKIAYVSPMTSLRKTMKKVFAGTKGLSSSLVKGPYDLFDGKEKFDIVLVDEAHRLARRSNITDYRDFDLHAEEIGINKEEATQLDMVVARSRYRILVYDEGQSVKGSDITPEQFERATNRDHLIHCQLTSQMRCLGGERFVDYLSSILACSATEPLAFDSNEYDFRLFDDVERMVEAIRINNKAYGLSRIASGYAWKWVSKPYVKEGLDYIKANHLEDIHIDGHHYVWNMTNEEYILSDTNAEQIGCIHTMQGYDLNYVGVIFGNEIDYDIARNEIVIDKDNFYDTKVKSGVDGETLKRYIVNAYKVMMSRGIKGCYVYACKRNLREYLRKFIKGE